jgi:Holliday junction resolvase RusA-like endonuclease
MFAFDDSAKFVKVLSLDVPWAHSYADMRPGRTDRERRENYRNAAAGVIKAAPAKVLWWAFRITVNKAGRPLDVDNIAKTIIDSFCASQILRDSSSFTHLGLYPDDTFDHVRVLQVIGNRSTTTDSTWIEVFACVQE